jgi:LPXTG-motif cell wall-anchored protein
VLRKLMLIVGMLAMVLAFAAPALAQSDPKVVADAKAKTATAGAAKAEADCKDGMIESNAGGVVAKAPCKPPPPAPAPKAEAPKAEAPAPAPKAEATPAPAPPKAELPKTGGGSAASLFALGAGALLVGAGLLVRRIIK